MNVYFSNPRNSHAIERVVQAMRKYAPESIVPVEDSLEADLVVLHVTGRNGHAIQEAQEIQKHGKSYAVIQYAVASTRNPDPQDWMPLWKDARLVWSYYDLPIGNLYRSPLAADPQVFYREETEKKYLVGTLGHPDSFRAECFGEVHLAAFQVQGKVVHIGERPDSNPIVDYVSWIGDEDLRKVYNQCRWFSALRRKEGFEIPAVEALLCGVRPILFDTPNYRKWFDGLAEFIPETSSEDTVKRLRNLFKKEPQPVKDADTIKHRFNWETIVQGFWEQCMN